VGSAGLSTPGGRAVAERADAQGVPPGRARPGDRRGGDARPIAAVVATCVACAAVYQHCNALDYSFSQDDFLGLARATGLAPRLAGVWRLASHQLAWDALLATAGPDARVAHAASIALWGLLSALCAWLLTRRLGLVAGIVGGTFLAAHPAAFTAVWWISAHGDTAASLLALAALAAWRRGERARWAAPPLLLAALLFKESVLLLPVVAAAVSRFAPGERTPRAFHRDPAWLAMAALMPVWLVLARPTASLGGEAYALSPTALFPNLLTYAGWTLDAWGLTIRNISDAVAPWEFGWGLAWLGLLALACALPALRRRGGAVATVGWLAMVAPVLPAAHHTYHYYLVAALPYAAWLVGAMADAVLPRGRVGIGIALATGSLFVFNGLGLTDALERTPFPLTIRADRTVDRALVAANALRDLRAAGLPPHARLMFWSPQSQAIDRDRGRDPAYESYGEANMRAALLDGLAVRVMLPGVDSVRFVRGFDPADTTWRWCVYRPDGALRVARGDELARVIASAPARAGAVPPPGRR
jgi:hypothetical protein